MGEAPIRLDGLTRNYGKRRGVTDLTFEVEEGETFGFLGPNGAGKTTTIRQLMGHMRPTGGSASVFLHYYEADGPADQVAGPKTEVRR
jgi:ABC-2 type transport system ATP-binding protein